jgi:hypothetical protein
VNEERTPARSAEGNRPGNPDIDVNGLVYGNLQNALSALSEVYGINRAEAVDCLTLMAGTMRDGSNGTDADEVTTLDARFHWRLDDAAKRGEGWALNVVRTLITWDEDETT